MRCDYSQLMRLMLRVLQPGLGGSSKEGPPPGHLPVPAVEAGNAFITVVHALRGTCPSSITTKGHLLMLSMCVVARKDLDSVISTRN